MQSGVLERALLRAGNEAGGELSPTARVTLRIFASSDWPTSCDDPPRNDDDRDDEEYPRDAPQSLDDTTEAEQREHEDQDTDKQENVHRSLQEEVPG